jgi:hypothetical protein
MCIRSKEPNYFLQKQKINWSKIPTRKIGIINSNAITKNRIANGTAKASIRVTIIANPNILKNVLILFPFQKVHLGQLYLNYRPQ